MSVRQKILDSPAFKDFMRLVQERLTQQIPDESLIQASLAKEKSTLEQQCQGWRMSLSNPKLSAPVRLAVEEDMERALERITAIDIRIMENQSFASRRHAAVDAVAVAERLESLGEILGAENASATNLILAQHIDGIFCNSEGKVVVRLCQLGALGNPDHLQIPEHTEPETGGTFASDRKSNGRRRRTRRRVNSEISDDQDVSDAANDFAVDVFRFSGLGPQWFTEEVFYVPQRTSWAEDYAKEVAEYRLSTHATMEKTASHFDKSVPTIRAALNYALEQHGMDAFGKHISADTRAYWPRDYAAAVAEFFARPGANMKAAEAHFQKSQTWISKAKKIAREGSPSTDVPQNIRDADDDQEQAA